LPLDLEWSAPLECPTGEQVQRELAHLVRARSGRSLLALAAKGTITPQGDSYRLELVVTRDGAERESRFDSPTCAPLSKAATLALALAFGDGAAPVPAPAPKEPPTEAPANDAPPVRDFAPKEAKLALDHAPLRVLPWAGAVASSGFVGPRALGAEVGLGLGGRYWTGFAHAYAFGPSVAAEREGVRAELSAAIGAVGACAGTAWARLRFDGCLAFDVGAVRAHSLGAEHDGFVTLPWLALAPSIVGLLPLPHPFALRAELALELPLAAARYDVAPLGTLYATARVIPRGSLGVSVRL
jgi:hypothetical protein